MNKFYKYYDLNRAAEFLYKNQNVIKNAYNNIYDKMKNHLKTESDEALKTMFYEYAKEELEKMTFEEI